LMKAVLNGVADGTEQGAAEALYSKIGVCSIA